MQKLAVAFLLVLVTSTSFAQDIPMFTADFPPDEFGARRARVYEAIGDKGLALIQGAPSPDAYIRFRQNNEFYYLSGIEVPHAYLLLDGAQKRTALYLPHRNAGRERSEGKLLSAEDADEIKKLTGVDSVFAIEALAEHLARMARSGGLTIHTPFHPGEGMAMSRDLALRRIADTVNDPWDGRASREAALMSLLRSRFPQFEVLDLTPVLDKLRLIKSPRELALIRKATRLAGLALMEGMRSTEPGMLESELDAMAKFIYYRNGAQGDAYYSLIANGPNAIFPHYNAGKARLKDGDLLLMDYAPDVGYYMSDITRVWPVNGTFSTEQKALYSFYLTAYRAVLDAIRPGVTPQTIHREALVKMDALLKGARFEKETHTNAAKAFVDRYRHAADNPRATLGHWVGMATHDVGVDSGPLRPGMVFTIEPALVVPEEKIYIRLEDLIIITEKGKEIVSDFVPMDVGAIEALMKEEGILQRYPRDAAVP
jgi:Xaa-Pro aminopeptidase